MGVNLGHKCAEDDSWVTYLQRLGVNGARVFGLGGISGGTLVNTVGPTSYGDDLNGVPVTTWEQWSAAVALLRTPAGHNSTSTAWSNPARFAQIEQTLNTTDDSEASEEIDGNPTSTIASLASLGIVPLVVTQISCASFDFVTEDPNQPAYWGERWELYKHQYAVSLYTWKRGIRKIEFWNEPDLTAGSSAKGAACMSPSRWLEQYTLRSQAIQDAYADFNADCSAGRLTASPMGNGCALTPIVTASAFASRTFGGDPVQFFGQPTMDAERLRFPPHRNVSVTDGSWWNLQAYSYHSYGKEGDDLAKATKRLIDLVNTVRSAHGGPGLPIYTTEHASKTASSWNLAPSSSDDYFEASRLASQLLWMGSYGLEQYVFKFSSTPSNHAGVVKSGLHWGENERYPYPMGDTTASGEAARMVITRFLGADRKGGKRLLNCTTPSTYRPCALIEDGNHLNLVLVNDGVATATSGAAKPVGLWLNVSLAPLVGAGVQAGSVAVVQELSSAGYWGEVSSLVTLTAPGYLLTGQLPPWAVMTVTIPLGRQVVTVLPATDDATLRAGANRGTNFGGAATLTVGTSITATHDTTSVALLRFDLAAVDGTALDCAVLELSVTAATAGPSVLLIVAVSALSWAQSSVTWVSAPGAVSVPAGAVAAVADNFARLDGGNTICGHITVRPGDVGALKRVDVTECVAANAGGAVTLLLARRMRNGLYTGNTSPAGGILADTLNGGASVAFASSEAADAAVRPALRLLLDYVPSPPPSPPPFPSPPPGAAAAVPSPPPPPLPPNQYGYTSTTTTTTSSSSESSSTADTDGVIAAAVSIASLMQAAGEDGSCASWVSPRLHEHVRVRGVVTARFPNASVPGFLIQDGGGPFSAVAVLLDPAHVGSLGGGAGMMPDAVGDDVAVVASVERFKQTTALQAVSSVELLRSNASLPPPVNVTTGSFVGGCAAAAERWRNMVVRFADVTLSLPPLAGSAELVLDDGSGPTMVEDHFLGLPTALAALAVEQAARACGVAHGDTIRDLVGVLMFDESQSDVALELGDPPLVELGIIVMDGVVQQLGVCPPPPPSPPPPPAPPPPPPLAQAQVPFTVSGIDPSTFSLAALQQAVSAALASSGGLHSWSLAPIDFPVTARMQLTGLAASPDGALANASDDALARALAFGGHAVLASRLTVDPVAAAARRSRAMLAGGVSGALDLALYGSQSAPTAGVMAAALAAAVADATPKGFFAQLSAAGVTLTVATLSTPPRVAVRFVVSVAFTGDAAALAGGSAFAAASAALGSGLSAALASVGVAFANVTITASPQPAPASDDDMTAAKKREIIGAVLGSVCGAGLIAAALTMHARRARRLGGADVRCDYAGKDLPAPAEHADEVQVVQPRLAALLHQADEAVA